MRKQLPIKFLCASIFQRHHDAAFTQGAFYFRRENAGTPCENRGHLTAGRVYFVTTKRSQTIDHSLKIKKGASRL